MTSQYTNLSNRQVLLQGVSPTSPKYQQLDISNREDDYDGNNALDLQTTPSYHLPTYTIFPPVKLPSFQEWKQQSSGKKESEEEEDKREKWEFPLLQTEENQEGPPMPKINIFPQQQLKGLPFKDKEGWFNYADASCGAKVLKTNKNAKAKNNILKKDKNSYLMNECSYSEKFIEIELCDTIWVTSVVMGNLELYSSNFKEIKISVSKNYPPNPEDGWNEISTYTSNNWKQLQRFNTDLGKSIKKQFVKYLRVDLKSHYGNEFYCPITQVIVHGVTMLEDHRGKGKNHGLLDEEEEGTSVDESTLNTSPDNWESEASTDNDSNTPQPSPLPSPTQKEKAIPPKPVELPKEPYTVCTLTEEVLKKHQVPINHHTTTTPLPKQDSNSSQVSIRSIPQPNSGPNTENEAKVSKSLEPIKPTERPLGSRDFSYPDFHNFNKKNFNPTPLPPILQPIIPHSADEAVSEPFSEAENPTPTLAPSPIPTFSTEPSATQMRESQMKKQEYDNGSDDFKYKTIPEPFNEVPRPIQTLTPFQTSTASTESSTSQSSESETKGGVYEGDDDDDDDHDNIFKTITQRLTKLEKDFGLLQDYLQVQTSEFNRALLDFQDDQKGQLIKSYLFLNSTLNLELYELRRLQGAGWAKLMEVLDTVGERSKNEVNTLREELNTIQFIVKWLVLGEFILILGIIIIYIIFKWFKSNHHHSSSSINTSAKADLKFKIKQN